MIRNSKCVHRYTDGRTTDWIFQCTENSETLSGELKRAMEL
jgi:hypothetical protein